MRFVSLLSFVAIGGEVAQACTTFAAGKKATADGSVIVSQSSDGAPLQDARLIYVPAAGHQPGDQRPIYYANEVFPRFVSKDFGPDYAPDVDTGPNLSKPIGYIPQVSHTFGYRDTSYGVINENNVGIGETTCSSMFQTCGRGTNIGCEEGRTIGEALMSIDSLTKIAMERSTTARGAVQLMGDLAVQYGFYGTQDNNGHGEALQVGDADEAFTFNILADPTGKSAIWAARRVPDENVTVMANMFTIREVDLNDPFNYLASPNIHSIAQERGWWKPGQSFDFTRIYSNGEYAHKYYSGRRMWGAFRLIGPSQNLSVEYDDLRYDRGWPWSMKPDKLITPQDVFRYYRDWYGGTQFDMTKGPAAGPFGSPDRFETNSKLGNGLWERTIAIYRTNEIHVQQLRKPSKDLPKQLAGVSWFAAGAAHYSPFLPIPSGLTSSLPSLRSAAPYKFDSNSMNWLTRRVASVCQIRFDKMHERVEARQTELENAGVALVAPGSDAARFGLLSPSNIAAFDFVFEEHAGKALSAWSDLIQDLLFRFADNTDLTSLTNDNDTALGYPDDWLQSIGYKAHAPPPVPIENQCPPKCPPVGTVVV